VLEPDVGIFEVEHVLLDDERALGPALDVHVLLDHQARARGHGSRRPLPDAGLDVHAIRSQRLELEDPLPALVREAEVARDLRREEPPPSSATALAMPP
jgi:hypothetical protein